MSSLDIFFDPHTMQDLCTNIGSANHTFKQLVAANMMSAAGSGLRMASTSITAKAGADVLNVMHILGVLGYKCTLSGSNLTVSW